MKTRTSVTTNKQSLKEVNKRDKVTNSTEESKEASYRESHNIGRRKSNDSVVTYSLNSHMFFDVYAKFDQNVICGKNGVIKSPRKSLTKIQSDSNKIKTPPKEEISSKECFGQVNAKKDDGKKFIRRSPRKISEVVEKSRSPLKEKIVTEGSNSEKFLPGMLPNEENLSEVRLFRNVGRRKFSNNPKSGSSEKCCLETAKSRSVASEDNYADDGNSHKVGNNILPNVSKRASLRRSSAVRSIDGEIFQGVLSDVSSDEYHSRKSSPRRMKVSCEAVSVKTDESIIISPTLDQISPFKSPRQKRTSTLKVSPPESHHSSNIEAPPTNTETFHRLLENKTVFKKHLSKVSLLKKSNTKTKRRESERINKVIKQLQTVNAKDGEVLREEVVSLINNQKSKNLVNNPSLLCRKKTKIKKIEMLKIVPLREKRIASLNAAAIINCVQSLFENERRSRSKSSGRGECHDDEDITLELDTEETPETGEEHAMKSELSGPEAEETAVVREVVNETKETNQKNKINKSENESSEIKSRVEELIVEDCKKYAEFKSDKDVKNDCETKEKNVVKRNYGRFFDITTTASQRNFEKVSIPPKKVKSVKSFEREVNNLAEEDKSHKKIKMSKERGNEEQLVFENGKEGGDEMNRELTKDESSTPQISEGINERKSMKSAKNGNVIRKKEEKSLFRFKEGESNKKESKVNIKKQLSKKIIKKEINEKIILTTMEDNADSSWLWEGDGDERFISLQAGSVKVTRMCYPAIRHIKDDVIIKVMDCVMLRSVDDQEPYLAKIISFFLDEDTGKKMMVLLWYYRPEHTDQGRLMWHTEADVYASKHLDTNSIDCIEDKAFVLPMEMYSRFMSYHKRQCSSSRQGLTARIVPNFVEDTDLMESEESQTFPIDVTMGMFASDFYHTSNFLTSFLSEMTTSNVFVCRGLYDIQQHKITRNILKLIQSPVREPELERCPSVDSAMSISSCNSESRLIDHHSLLDIPLPPNIEDICQHSLPSFIDSTVLPITSFAPLPPKSLTLSSFSKSYIPFISQSLSSLNSDVLFSTATNGL